MTFTTSDIALGAIAQMYASLDIILEKAEAYARDREIDEFVLLGWRFAADMFPMARQVQIATDISTRGLARLAGVAPESFPDTETSFAELRARVARARDHINSLDVAAIDAEPDANITVPMRGGEMTMPRRRYFLGFVLPNLYFHVTTAYGLLRAAGVPLGKADYLAWRG